MRATPILLAVLLASVSLAALAPTASAKPYCTYGEKGCEWDLVCLWRPTEVCVGDPCWFMCEPMAASAATCVPLAQGHYYFAVCVDPRAAPECAVYTVRAYAGEVFVSCVGVDAPAVAMGGPGVECMDVYNEWSVGPVTVIQRSSCDYEVVIHE